MTERISTFRLVSLATGISASVVMLISSQLPWGNMSLSIPLIGRISSLQIGTQVAGLDIQAGHSVGLTSAEAAALIAVAVIAAALAALSVLPYLRFFSMGVVLIGGTCVAYALDKMYILNQPVKAAITAPHTFDILGHSVHIPGITVTDVFIQLSPGMGIYVLLVGATLAIISGMLTLLTPRTARPRYQHPVPLYQTPIN